MSNHIDLMSPPSDLDFGIVSKIIYGYHIVGCLTLTNKILPSKEGVLGEAGHPQALEVDVHQRALLQFLLHRPVHAVVLLVFHRVGFLQQLVFLFPLYA